MTNAKIDPELADDRNVEEADVEVVDLPAYDGSQFELPEDFEYPEDDGDENAD